MALIDDLITKINDPALRERIEKELAKLNKNKKFGLVFEEHVPEYVPLYDVKIKKGSTVTILDSKSKDTYLVKDINENEALCINKVTYEEFKFNLESLVSIAEFGDPIYPNLNWVDSVKNDPEGDLWHILIEADNYHALQLLEYIYAKKIDCIYIDPPYNSRAKDWKYNNDYVDPDDLFKHSKWLSMMEKRLRLAKKLLNPLESVLICTIDEKEFHHLGCLLEDVFPEARIQMITSVINPKGSARDYGFSRTEEYIYIVYIGKQVVNPTDEDMLRKKNVEGKPVRWASLQRSGSDSRRYETPTMFYPIFINKSDKSFHSTGDSLPLEKDRNSITPPDGTIAIFPLGRENDERRWQLSQETLQERISKGYVKFGKWNEDKQSLSINYLSTGVIDKIESGDIKILGYDEDGSVILENVKSVRPVSVWNKATHSASEYGSSLLNHIMPDRKFPYPKSVYAVLDTLRFFVSDKPDAKILDFFAGSGTTLHAVNLLNLEDKGNRQCIMVTNNEVSIEEEKVLKRKGFKPGDSEWEKLGIAHYITWPRTKSSIMGLNTNNEPLTNNYKFSFKKQASKQRNIKHIDFASNDTLNTLGKKKNFISNLSSDSFDLKPSIVSGSSEYIISDNHNTSILFNDEFVEDWLENIRDKEHIINYYVVTENKKLFNYIKKEITETIGKYNCFVEEDYPMARGFKTNAIFYKLGFLDKTSVALGKQLRELLPILWMKAGGIGECPTINSSEDFGALIYPRNKFAILINENRFVDFKKEIEKYSNIRTVFIITDSDEGYTEMSSMLGVAETYQLYKDYLDNFRINIRR